MAKTPETPDSAWEDMPFFGEIPEVSQKKRLEGVLLMGAARKGELTPTVVKQICGVDIDERFIRTTIDIYQGFAEYEQAKKENPDLGNAWVDTPLFGELPDKSKDK